MATRAQAVQALKKHCPEATLELDEGPDTYCAQIEAPKGMHWEGDVHCRSCGEWFKSQGKRSEYWDLVIEIIQDLPLAVKCTDSDCEGIRTFGVCDYWEDHDLEESALQALDLNL